MIDISGIQRKTGLQTDQIKNILIENEKFYVSNFLQRYPTLNPVYQDAFRLNRFFPTNWKQNTYFWPERI